MNLTLDTTLNLDDLLKHPEAEGEHRQLLEYVGERFLPAALREPLGRKTTQRFMATLGGLALNLGAVRPIPVSAAKPQVVIPADFNDAQQLGDRFKASQPVIINLQGADLDLARRVIDFASGLCYGLGGQMERVASQVYLLTPNDVEVSDEDRRRITERGLGRR